MNCSGSRQQHQGGKCAEGPVYGAQKEFCGHCGRELDRQPSAHGPAPHLCTKCASPSGRAARHAVKDADQLGIPLFPLDRRGRTIAERYDAWRATAHGKHVYDMFCSFAYRALNSGVKRYSHKWIVERVRWEVWIETKSPDSFKINNDYTSRMARELVNEDVRFGSLFQLRALRTP